VNQRVDPRRRIRVVLDSNAVDDLLESNAYETLQAAVSSGTLDVMWTHITVDELAAIPDLERRAHLLCLAVGLARMVPTSACVLGYSRLNFARLGDDEEAFEAFRKGNLRHTRDALVAATAALESAAVLTNDQQLKKRCRAREIQAINVYELLTVLAEES
jgi:rRNA-processing protein FCF1